MAAMWFVRGGGKVYGPLDSNRLKQLAAEGKINEATEVAQNQAGPWHPAGKVRGLFDTPTATTPAYSPAPAPQAYAAPQAYTPPTYSPPQPAPEPVEPTPAAPLINVNRRTIAAYYPRSNTGMIVAVAGLCSLASLVLGYFAGREHLRYQIRSSFEDAGKKFAKDLKEGLGKAFGGETQEVEKKKPEPVAKLAVGKTYNAANATVTLTSAKTERPFITGGLSREPSQHKDNCLVLTFSIRNKDDRKQLDINYGDMFSGSVFKLYDDVGNDIRTMFFSGADTQYKMVGAHPSYKDIDPEQSIDHAVAFEMPLPKTKALSLVIDLKLIGQEGVVQYTIPIDQVEGFSGK